jgi:hypothetical protein
MKTVFCSTCKKKVLVPDEVVVIEIYRQLTKELDMTPAPCWRQGLIHCDFKEAPK